MSPPGDGPPGVAIVANPYSGARANRELVESLVAALRARGLEPHVIWSLDELAATLTSKDLTERYRAVVAAGGDGTLHRVINHELRLPIAVLPLGNENLFARQFGFTREPTALVNAIARNATRWIDLGSVNDQRFSIVVSAGFDGEVAHRLANWRSRGTHLRRVRSHSYVIPVLAAAWHYGYPEVTVEADGQMVRGALAMVFNLPAYCLNLQLAPDAICDDGLLDWVVFRRPGRVPLAGYALSVVLRRHRLRGDVLHGRAREISLRSEEPVPMEIDGEAAGQTPVSIAAIPRAVRVVVA
jgi:YegS/Rv2252/BmrU family lipid kinase